MLPPVITIKKARVAYPNKLIFSDLSFELPVGQWIGLLGPSGVGKSTLLKMIAGLMTAPDTTMITDHPIALGQQTAYMAQSDLLLPWLTVIDNTLLSIKLRYHTKKERKAKYELAVSLLKQVGLNRALYLYPHELSGGMRQRVALIRTLLTEKPIILMDEPFSALDAITRYKLQALAVETLRDKTVLFITHDPLEALRLAHLIYVMKGHPATINPFTAIHTPIPREMNDPDMIAYSAKLYQALSLAQGDE